MPNQNWVKRTQPELLKEITKANKQVVFDINWETLAFYGPDRTFRAESGEFEIMTSGNSEDLSIQNIELI